MNFYIPDVDSCFLICILNMIYRSIFSQGVGDNGTEICEKKKKKKRKIFGSLILIKWELVKGIINPRNYVMKAFPSRELQWNLFNVVSLP